jgi:hypothetical protein
VEMTDCRALAANSVSGGPAPRLHLMPLNQRYALGDIGRTEYLQNRDDILAALRIGPRDIL